MIPSDTKGSEVPDSIEHLLTSDALDNHRMWCLAKVREQLAISDNVDR